MTDEIGDAAARPDRPAPRPRRRTTASGTSPQALAGTTLGVAAGAVVARTAPQARPGRARDDADRGRARGAGRQPRHLGHRGCRRLAPRRRAARQRQHRRALRRARIHRRASTARGSSVRNFLEGVNVSDGDVAIALQRHARRASSASPRAPATARCTLEGDASLGEAPQARLRLEADRFQLLGRVDRRIVASGNGAAAARPRRRSRSTARFDGRRRPDRLHPLRRAEPRRRRPGRRAAAGPAPPRAAPRLRPAHERPRRTGAPRVERERRARPAGRHGRAACASAAAASTPACAATCTSRRRATASPSTARSHRRRHLRGVRPEARPSIAGQLTFSGAIENPRLDIEATRPNLDIRVGVAVTGTALNPRVRLFSEPELSRDRQAQLAGARPRQRRPRPHRHRACCSAPRWRCSPAKAAARRTSSSKSLGLDDLSVRQSEGEVRETDRQPRQAALAALVRRLRARLQRDHRHLAADLPHRPRFTLRAQSGGDNSVDVIWTWRWQ